MIKDLSNYSRSDLEHAIDEWIILRRHSQRNREILKRYLLDGICFEPLSEEFGISVRQAKNIVYKTQEQLFKHL